MRLQQAMIFVKHIDRMSTFYQDGLGFRPIPERCQEGFVVLDAGGATLALHAIPEAYAKDIEITTPPRSRSDTPIKLFFEVDDVLAARAHLAGHGAVMSEPRSPRSCDGLDPEGNVFTIVSR